MDVYIKEIRSVLELAVPTWNGGLTCSQRHDFERVQKVAAAIIIGTRLPYETALAQLGLASLDARRNDICKKFARKTLKGRHADIFSKNQNPYETRNKSEFTHAACKTKRFFDSPINFLTRVLNEG